MLKDWLEYLSETYLVILMILKLQLINATHRRADDMDINTNCICSSVGSVVVNCVILKYWIKFLALVGG